jgi:hypothetical protein
MTMDQNEVTRLELRCTQLEQKLLRIERKLAVIRHAQTNRFMRESVALHEMDELDD